MPILKKVIATLNSLSGNLHDITVPTGKQITISCIAVSVAGDPTVNLPGGRCDMSFRDASLIGLPPESQPYELSGSGLIIPYSEIKVADTKYLTIGLTFREGDVITTYLEPYDTNVMTVTIFGAVEDIGDTTKTVFQVQNVTLA